MATNQQVVEVPVPTVPIWTTIIAWTLGVGGVALGLFTGNDDLVKYSAVLLGGAAVPALFVIRSIFMLAKIPIKETPPVITTSQEALKEMNKPRAPQ